MMRRIFLLLFVILMLPATVLAQDVLVSGEPVTGEITDDAFAVEYSYDGLAGQVVVIELFPVDALADYDQPSIIIQSSDGAELLRRDSFGDTTAFFTFPADDTYKIIASRADDAAGTSVGEYTLELIVPQAVKIDDVLTGTMGADDDVYYLYEGEDDFNVLFAREGQFAPEVSINTIDTDITPGSLDTLGGLYGEMVTRGVMGTFTGGNTYIIRLGAPLFSFNFGDPVADYTLQIYTSDE